MARKKPPAAAKNTAAPKSRPAGDDRAVWEHVVKSVTPLPGRRKAAVKSEKPAEKNKVAAAKTAAPARARAAPPAVKNAGPAAGFDRSTETKMRRGQLGIEGRLDLHGMTQAVAHRALDAFISRAARDGKRMLLVITGKGRLGDGGGVLRRVVPQWLLEGSLAAHVLAVTPAQPKDGGDGALYVRLRKKT